MQSPDGQTLPNEGCYLEIVPNKKLVWTNALELGFRPAKQPEASPGNECAEFLMTATIMLEPRNGGTKYIAMVQHANSEARVKHDQRRLGAALDQLIEMINGNKA